jgi:hypothetical protein
MRKLKHGHATNGKLSPTYNSWSNMVSRCNNPKNPKYSYYGGVGITVCADWVKSFSNFLADMGERPPESTLDRVDGLVGYSKQNCRWATRSQQQLNRKCCKKITFNNETHHWKDWAKIVGIRETTLRRRLQIGWSAEKSLTTKQGKRKVWRLTTA